VTGYVRKKLSSSSYLLATLAKVFRRLVHYRVRRWVLIVVSCLAVFAGVALARHSGLDDARWLWLVALAVMVSLRRHNFATLVLLALLFLGIGWWRGSEYMDKLAVHQSLHFEKVTVVGQAAGEAVYGQRYQLEFSLRNVQVIAPRQTALVGGLTVRGFGEPAIYRGDVVQVTGKLYPTRGNNLGSISFAQLDVLQRDSSWINTLRREFAAGMQSALPEPAASFGLGLLIGQRSTLPEATEDQLRHVGLTHIIAVSGYNLTIIVLASRRLLAKRSKFQATAACLGLIGLFLLITGFSPPIVRAAIVSLLTIGAWYYGRNIKPLALLLLAAGITVIANPLYLWGNVSWYLSFLAFFGVLVLAPLITKRLFGGKEPTVLVGIVIESLCASMLVIPYILYIFGEISLVSLPANLLVIPFIPLAMLLALVAGLAGMWVPVLAGWLAWPAKTLLTYMLDVAHLLSRVPHAFVQHISFPLFYMVSGYTIIGLVVLSLWFKTKHKPNSSP
jgi:competence protein ComEC